MAEGKTPRGSFIVKDEAPEQKYYGSVPHMVWYLGLHPLHITVYAYLIRVAGKTGVCWQSTKTIAKATSVSAGKISEARKVLAAAGLIKITKPGSVGRGHSYEITIPNLWAINIGYIDQDPKYVAQVEAMAEKVHAMNFSKKTSPHERKTSPHEPKKNPEEEHCKERESNDANVYRRVPSKAAQSSPEIRETDERPKRVITGTGDTQRDRVDSADAGVSAVQAKDLLARAMYQLLWPTLPYPEGRTKRAREARRSAEIAADRVLERIGREGYQDALDACHLLLTEPTDKEDKWIDQLNSIYGLVDPVTKRVDGIRSAAQKRAAAVEMNRETLERQEYEIGIDPRLGADTTIVIPPEYANVWERAKVDLQSSLARATYDTWVADAVLQEVTEDGQFIVGVGSRGAVDWLESNRLKPLIMRTLQWVADRPIEISFVLKNGVDDED